ncbi:MAG TPA: hypothetical protein VF693_08575 [Allosphingosinicella sp.]|jgi:uncharacterized membrane protein YfcA
MVYEARHAKGINWALAVAVALLSILGFAVAGVIPTQSGSHPLVGWGIVAACFAAAFIFIRRASDDKVHIRIDERGVWTPRAGPDPVPWSEIGGVSVIRAGIQRIARFHRTGGKDFGINTTFYDRGIRDLIAAVRHHRPDLVP